MLHEFVLVLDLVTTECWSAEWEVFGLGNELLAMVGTEGWLSAKKDECSSWWMDGCVQWVGLSDKMEFDGCWMNHDWEAKLGFWWPVDFYGAKNTLRPMGGKRMDKKQDSWFHVWEVSYEVWWFSDEAWWSIWMEWNSGVVRQLDWCDTRQPNGESKCINTVCTRLLYWVLQMLPSIVLKVTTAYEFSFNKRQFPPSLHRPFF